MVYILSVLLAISWVTNAYADLPETVHDAGIREALEYLDIKVTSVGNQIYAFTGTTSTGTAGIVAISHGGTGATSAAGARTNLSVPDLIGTGASGTWNIGILGNAATVTNGVYTNGSYSDPAWITSLSTSKIDLSTVTAVILAHAAALSTAAYTPVNNTFLSTNTFRQTITAPNYRISDSVVLSTTNGDSSISVGVLAGDNSTGLYNTYLGEWAGRWQSSGKYNTLLGYQAGYGSALALPFSSNTIVGAMAGNDLTYGSHNILIGYGVTTPLPTTDNHINIGNLYFGDMATSSASIAGSLWANNVYASNLISSTAAFITSTAAIVASTAPIFYIAQDTGTLWGMFNGVAYSTSLPITSTAALYGMFDGVAYSTSLPITSTATLASNVGAWNAFSSTFPYTFMATTNTWTGTQNFQTITSTSVCLGGVCNQAWSSVTTDLTGVAYSSGVIPSSATGQYPLWAQYATNARNSDITDNVGDSGPVYLVWSGLTTGYAPLKVSSSRLTFAPATGILSATSFSGSGANLTGVITSTAAIISQLGAHEAAISTAATLTGANTFIQGAQTIGSSLTVRGAIYSTSSLTALSMTANGSLRVDHTFDVGLDGTTPVWPPGVQEPSMYVSAAYNGQGLYVSNWGYFGSTLTVGSYADFKGTATVQGSAFSVGGSTLTVSNGLIGVGIASPKGNLHISSGAGNSYTPNANGTDLILERTGNAGMSIISPDTGLDSIIFGSPGDAFGALIRWDFTNKQFSFLPENSSAVTRFGYANGSEGMRIDTAGNVGIGTTAPDQKLTVAGNISTTGQVISSGTGNNYFAGFSKFGELSTGLKSIILSTTTALAEGGTTTVLHGLTASKIVSITAACYYTTNGMVPPGITAFSEFQYDVYADATSAYVMLSATNSGSILNKNIKIIIWYVE